MGERIRDSVWDRHGVIADILNPVKIPKIAEVEQIFHDNTLKDVPAAVLAELKKPEIAGTVKPGMSVAVTAGSRGIANLAVILREVVAALKAAGAKPFIFPAMGSHGGATAAGQIEVLSSYGVTEEAMGCPIKSSMNTVTIGTTDTGKPVHIDGIAHGADGIVVVARVKPHTAFRGDFESGLYKMMVIGMGKQKGAEICHDEGFGRMGENIPRFGDIIVNKAKILFGLAIIENAFDNTCILEAVPREKIREREPALLRTAKDLMPKILFPKFDILVVDQIGKNFSGDGADPNITATYCTPYATGGPEFERYVVLDLSEETHGNAIGIGMADFTTKRVFDKTDFDSSYPNALTATVVSGVRMPLVLKNDKTALQAAIFSAVNADKGRPRIVRIKNTSHIERVWISEALMEEAKSHPQVRVVSPPAELAFNADGNLW